METYFIHFFLRSCISEFLSSDIWTHELTALLLKDKAGAYREKEWKSISCSWPTNLDYTHILCRKNNYFHGQFKFSIAFTELWNYIFLMSFRLQLNRKKTKAQYEKKPTNMYIFIFSKLSNTTNCILRMWCYVATLSSPRLL